MQAYQDSIVAEQNRRKKTVLEYASILKRQEHDKREQGVNRNRMNPEEKNINRCNLQAYKAYDNNYYASIPGWGNNLRLNPNAKHPLNLTDIHDPVLPIADHIDRFIKNEKSNAGQGAVGIHQHYTDFAPRKYNKGFPKGRYRSPCGVPVADRH